MTEIEAYTQLGLIIGSLMVLPLIYRIFYVLSQQFILRFFPAKYIELEIKDEAGKIIFKKVEIAKHKELIDALSKSTGRAFR